MNHWAEERDYVSSPLWRASDPSSALVSPNPSVDSMAVGRTSGRTLHLIRHEGVQRETSLAPVLRKQLWLVLSLLHSGVLFFFKTCNCLVFIHTSVFSGFAVSSLGTNLFSFPLLIWEGEAEKFVLVFSSSRHFSFHIRPLLIGESSVLIMSSIDGWCNTWN